MSAAELCSGNMKPVASLLIVFLFNHFLYDGMVVLLYGLKRAEAALVQLLILSHVLRDDRYEAVFYLLSDWFIYIIRIPCRVTEFL